MYRKEIGKIETQLQKDINQKATSDRSSKSSSENKIILGSCSCPACVNISHINPVGRQASQQARRQATRLGFRPKGGIKKKKSQKEMEYGWMGKEKRYRILHVRFLIFFPPRPLPLPAPLLPATLELPPRPDFPLLDGVGRSFQSCSSAETAVWTAREKTSSTPYISLLLHST